MKTRRLGNSNLNITLVGLGAWAIGGGGGEFGWGPQDDTASVRAIHRALEHGVNWIDTAAAYGRGHSEEVVARALRDWQGTRPYVFTKGGLRWDAPGTMTRALRADSLRREVEESLRRLRVEAIDLYQIHWLAETAGELEEGWGTLAALRQQGKLRWMGASNFDVAQLRLAQRIAPVTSVQPPYSLISRGIEAEILPYALSQDIGVIVYSPMASGLLTGAMTRARIAAMPADDWRRRNAAFQEPQLARNLALADRLRAVGATHGRSAGEVAIAWALRHPAVTAAIVGARDASQVDGVIGGAAFALSSPEIAAIEAPLQGK